MTSTPDPTSSRIAPEDIWCAIPVYNNAGTIADVARRARAHIRRVLVIDDGSTDADLRGLLKDLDVQVVRHPANRGKGVALQTAFAKVRAQGGKYLVTLDGDGQHFPEDIPRLTAALEPDTIVLGRRTEVVGDRPSASHFGQDFSDFWIEVETGAALHDTQSGFRVYPLEPLAKLSLGSRHYTFEVEVLTHAVWAGLRVRSVPIRVSYSETTRRASSFRPFADNGRLSWLHARLVARQFLPLPHRRVVAARGDGTRGCWWQRLVRRNAAPLGLAAAIGLGLLQGVVLWPCGVLAVLYEAWRLHLNKIAALGSAALATLLLPPAWCMAAGRWVITGDTHPALAWIVGTHIIAFVIAPLMMVFAYVIVRSLRRGDSESSHEHR
jgi:glycosyltransferase involved in cell wall biosynthesis